MRCSDPPPHQFQSLWPRRLKRAPRSRPAESFIALNEPCTAIRKHYPMILGFSRAPFFRVCHVALLFFIKAFSWKLFGFSHGSYSRVSSRDFSWGSFMQNLSLSLRLFLVLSIPLLWVYLGVFSCSLSFIFISFLYCLSMGSLTAPLSSVYKCYEDISLWVMPCVPIFQCPPLFASFVITIADLEDMLRDILYHNFHLSSIKLFLLGNSWLNLCPSIRASYNFNSFGKELVDLVNKL